MPDDAQYLIFDKLEDNPRSANRLYLTTHKWMELIPNDRIEKISQYLAAVQVWKKRCDEVDGIELTVDNEQRITELTLTLLQLDDDVVDY